MTRAGWGFAGGWGLLCALPPLAWYPDWASAAGDPLYAAGRLCGLLGLAVCLAQPLGMSPLAMRLLGSSRMGLHKVTGMSGMLFLLAHPLLLVASEGEWGMLLWDATPAVWAGKAALLLMVVGVGAFLLVKWKKLKFPQFSRIHNLAYLAGLAGLGHAYFAGYSLRSTPPLLAYYVILALAGLYFYVRSKLKKRSDARARMQAAKQAG